MIFLHLYATIENAGNDSNFSKKIPVDFTEYPSSADIIKRTLNQCWSVLESWILQYLMSTDMLFRLFSGSEQVFSHYLELPQHFQIWFKGRSEIYFPVRKRQIWEPVKNNRRRNSIKTAQTKISIRSVSLFVLFIYGGIFFQK